MKKGIEENKKRKINCAETGLFILFFSRPFIRITAESCGPNDAIHNKLAAAHLF